MAFGPAAQTTLATGITGALAVDSVGDVFVADQAQNRVLEIPAGTTGQVPVPVTGVSSSNAVAVDGAGDAFIAMTSCDSIMELSAGASVPVRYYNTNFTTPSGLAADAAGDLFFSDGSSIWEVWADTRALGKVGNGSSVAVDPAGDVFISGASNVVELPAGGGPQITVFNGNASSVAADAAGDVFLSSGGSVLELQHPQAPTSLSHQRWLARAIAPSL
jgi:serine/threonine-protein kinase